MGTNRARRSIDTKTESKDSNARKLEKLNQGIYDYAIKQEIVTESANGKNRQFRHKPFCCDIKII